MLTLFLMTFRDSNRRRAARQTRDEIPEHDEVDGDKGRHDHVHGQDATNGRRRARVLPCAQPRVHDTRAGRRRLVGAFNVRARLGAARCV
jgi:hypothetical protein